MNTTIASPGDEDRPRRRRRKKKNQRIASNPTRLYAPRPGGTMFSAALSSLLDGAPIFTWLDVPRMIRDPRIRQGLRMLRSPLGSVQFKVKTNHPGVEQYVLSTISRFWRRVAPRLFLRYYQWGYAVGLLDYKIGKKRVHLIGGRAAEAGDTTPLTWSSGKKKGEFAGVRLRTGDDSRLIGSPHCLWFAGHQEYGRLYDRPRLQGAFEPWLEKRTRGGAIDARRLWFRKNAYRSGLLYYPPGQTNVGTEDSPINRLNVDIAREQLEYAETGSSLTFPNDIQPNTTQYAWNYQPPQSYSDVSGVREYPKDLDSEIMDGLGIPGEVLEANDVGSGWSGRAVPLKMFLDSADEDVSMMVECFDEQIMRDLVTWNFGDIEYEIEALPLAEVLLASNQDKQGGAAQQMGGDGGPFDAEDGVHKPPRPGLTWKKKTSRWVRSDNLAHEEREEQEPPKRVKAMHRKALLLALLEATEHEHATGEDTTHVRDELAKLYADPDRLEAVMNTADLAWVAAQTRPTKKNPSGSIKAEWSVPGERKPLYGERARRALEGQGQRKNKEQSAQRAHELAVAAAFGEASPEDFRELVDHLPSLNVERLHHVRAWLDVSFKDAKRKEMVSKLIEHAKGKADELSQQEEQRQAAADDKATAQQPVEEPKKEESGEKVKKGQSKAKSEAVESLIRDIDAAHEKGSKGEYKGLIDTFSQAEKAGLLKGADPEQMASIREKIGDMKGQLGKPKEQPKPQTEPKAGEVGSVEHMTPRMLQAINDLPTSHDHRYGPAKVWISGALEHVKKIPGYENLTMDKFRGMLLEANQKDLLDLVRADLIPDYDQKDKDLARSSEMNDRFGTFHMIRVHDKSVRGRGNPTGFDESGKVIGLENDTDDKASSPEPQAEQVEQQHAKKPSKPRVKKAKAEPAAATAPETTAEPVGDSPSPDSSEPESATAASNVPATDDVNELFRLVKTGKHSANDVLNSPAMKDQDRLRNQLFAKLEDAGLTGEKSKKERDPAQERPVEELETSPSRFEKSSDDSIAFDPEQSYTEDDLFDMPDDEFGKLGDHYGLPGAQHMNRGSAVKAISEAMGAKQQPVAAKDEPAAGKPPAEAKPIYRNEHEKRIYNTLARVYHATDDPDAKEYLETAISNSIGMDFGDDGENTTLPPPGEESYTEPQGDGELDSQKETGDALAIAYEDAPDTAKPEIAKALRGIGFKLHPTHGWYQRTERGLHYAQPEAIRKALTEGRASPNDPMGIEDETIDHHGFTGTDAQGREWVNGELVAAKDDPAAGNDPVAMVPDDYQKQVEQKVFDHIQSGQSYLKPGSVRMTDGGLEVYRGKQRGKEIWGKPNKFVSDHVWQVAQKELGLMHPGQQWEKYQEANPTEAEPESDEYSADEQRRDDLWRDYVNKHHNGDFGDAIVHVEKLGMSPDEFSRSLDSTSVAAKDEPAAHEMTKAEADQAVDSRYREKVKSDPKKYGGRRNIGRALGEAGKEVYGAPTHRIAIETAIAAGKSVPLHVLNDYPDLKQPHERTQAEYDKIYDLQMATAGGGGKARMPKSHEKSPHEGMTNGQYSRYMDVKSALSTGKPVPPEVLADYPDLAEKYGSKQAATSTGGEAEPKIDRQQGELASTIEESLADMDRSELVDMAKSLGIKGASKLDNRKLMKAIIDGSKGK